MASINGISLKAMKSFEGMEGTAWQGNVYVGTKKVAFWSQDGNGGPDWFDMMNGFSKKKLVGDPRSNGETDESRTGTP